jgi:hypothetical protein
MSDVYTYCSFVNANRQCIGAMVVRGVPTLEEYAVLAKRVGLVDGQILPVSFGAEDVDAADAIEQVEFRFYLDNLDKFFSPDELRERLAWLGVPVKTYGEWEQ